jgi:hypothetical protein
MAVAGTVIGVAYGPVPSRKWKWIGLGALAAIALGSAVVVERRRRHWRHYDTEEIRTRLHERFAALGADQHQPGQP